MIASTFKLFDDTTGLSEWLVGMLAAGVTWFLGDIDSAYTALLTFIVIDNLIGILALSFLKKYSWEAEKRDIIKKLLILLLVGISHIIDEILFSRPTLRTAVIYFYIGHQGISILKYATALGVPFPKKLMDLLEEFKTKSEQLENTVAEDLKDDIKKVEEGFHENKENAGKHTKSRKHKTND